MFCIEFETPERPSNKGSRILTAAAVRRFNFWKKLRSINERDRQRDAESVLRETPPEVVRERFERLKSQLN